MAEKDLPRSEAENPRREFRDLCLGLISSILLTGAAFALVLLHPAGRNGMLAGLALLALTQIAAQFRFFLHVDLKRSHRDDLQLILFTALVLGLMVGGSLWILFNQMARMG